MLGEAVRFLFWLSREGRWSSPELKAQSTEIEFRLLSLTLLHYV